VYQQDDTTQPMPGVPAEARSRRDFLKAAVIGSAAVATAGGAVAAGYALTSRKPSTVRFIGNEVSGDPCRACVTDTTLIQNQNTFKITSGGGSSPGSWYLWFTDHALPTGHYTVAVTVRKFAVNGGSTFTDYAIGGSGSPFDYQAGNNNVQIFSLATAQDCPTSLPTGPVDTFNTLADAANFSWTETGTNDMQMNIHLKYVGGTIGVAGTTEKIEFIITITAQGSQTPLCTETATLTGTQE
jgi:hypothetical protein